MRNRNLHADLNAGLDIARIAKAGRKAVRLELLEQTAPQPHAPDLWYGFAPLKAARLDYMVQKATKMGVGTIQPVIERTYRFDQIVEAHRHVDGGHKKDSVILTFE